MRIPVEQGPHHKWDTMDKPFSKVPCETVDTVIPRVGFPHPNVLTQRIRDWCLPLESNDETTDLVVMARSVQTEIETQAYISLKASLGEELDADDAVTMSVRAKALRFQRWFF